MSAAASALVQRCRAAIEAPADRAEINDLIRIETFRTTVCADPGPLRFEAVERAGLDRSAFDELADGRAEPEITTLGAWAQRAAVLPAFARVLYRLARSLGGPVLEIGTGTATSTVALATGAARTTSPAVVSLEPHPTLVVAARRHLATMGLDHVQVVAGTQEERGLELALRTGPTLVHIDSDHRSEPLGRLLDDLAGAFVGPTVVALDDIRWSDGMAQRWAALVDGACGAVATFDLELWGLVVLDPAASGPARRFRATAPLHLRGGTVGVLEAGSERDRSGSVGRS